MTNVETRVLLAEAQERVRELEADKAGLRHTVTELEDELADRASAVTTLVGTIKFLHEREVELGAENATLRERFSALWMAWAESLWHGDDVTRPAQPEDCSEMSAWLPLFMRAAEVMAEGAREIQTMEQHVAAVRAEHAHQGAAVAAELGTIQDGLSALQAQARAL